MLSSSSIAVAAGQGSAPRNNFLPADDVAIGTEAAATVRTSVALVKDEEINAFVAGIGRRLVDAIPGSVRQPAFRYSFEILDHMSVAIYGLPGGPVFASRGFLQSAASEQDVAQAIARAIGHIALRHGTAQATRATRSKSAPSPEPRSAR